MLTDAQAWARELSQGSAAALALTKSIPNQSFEASAEQIFKEGSQAKGICYTSTEHRDSVMTFLARSSKKE
jgi:enoyl-CoA hydratase/carnithine racemase